MKNKKKESSICYHFGHIKMLIQGPKSPVDFQA